MHFFEKMALNEAEKPKLCLDYCNEIKKMEQFIIILSVDFMSTKYFCIIQNIDFFTFKDNYMIFS